MTRHIDIHSRARKDLHTIYQWIARQAPRGAVAWYRAFWKAAIRIAEDTENHPVAEEAERLKVDIRFALFKTRKGHWYRIIYDFTDAEVRILRVRRPAQRPLRRRDLPGH